MEAFYHSCFRQCSIENSRNGTGNWIAVISEFFEDIRNESVRCHPESGCLKNERVDPRYIQKTLSVK